MDNDIRVLKGFERVEELPGILSGHYPDRICINFLKQSEIIQNVNARFLLADSEEKVLFHSIGAILGDFADVVTGFYCGDNKRFIRARGRDVKGANNYEIIQENQITEKASLDGVTEQGKKFIPYIKGASDIRYIRKPITGLFNGIRRHFSITIPIRKPDFKMLRFTSGRVLQFLW
ncbi:MAG: hypothetical protein HFI51_15190 [Lachnospiraceae bacterium]|nr:hypothetical protein [Lachnospiraceae bacterium]